MLLKKKTILFCEEKKFSPAVCVVEPLSFGYGLSVYPSAERVFVFDGTVWSEAERKGNSFFIKNYSSETAVAAAIDGKFYAEKTAPRVIAEEKKVLCENNAMEIPSEKEPGENVDKVKITYDDEAVSEVNYYPEQYVKKTGFRLLMREKGGFLNNDEKHSRQYSTVYPQTSNEERGRYEGDCYEENERFKSKKSENAEAQGNKNAACEKKDGSGDFGGEDGGESRLYSLREKTEAMLKEFPREELLERVMNGCRFAKITYSCDKLYVAGMSEEDGKPEYLFFGVPCKKGDEQPSEFSGKAYYVPTCGEAGYFLLCQDFYTGEIL